MFAVLTRASRTRKPVTTRFARLSLERLEDRLSPSVNETITLNVVYLPNRQATFEGQLLNQANPVANQQVNLTGVVNATATTDSQGHYSITLSVPQLGQEYAASGDGQSNTASYTLVGGSPVISNFSAVCKGNGVWCFSGTVSGAPTQGEVVNFGGIKPLLGQSTTVNSDGTFSFSITVTAGNGGWATAQAVDWWGDLSPIASEYVNA
jgi:hypothetical protein